MFVINSLDRLIRGQIDLDPEFFDVSLGWAVTISDDEFANLEFHDQAIARLVLGRELTKGEIGTSLAHRAIYRNFSEIDSNEFVICLEDDAIVDSENLYRACMRAVEETKKIINSSHPIVILLGYNADSVCLLSRNGFIARQLVPPTGTWGYMINQSAMKLLSSSTKVDFTPDWPIASRGIRFFAVKNPVVLHGAFKSLIDEISTQQRKDLDLNRTSVIQRILNVRTRREFVYIWQFLILRGIVFRFVLPACMSLYNKLSMLTKH